MAHTCLQKTVWEIKCCLASEKAYIYGQASGVPSPPWYSIKLRRLSNRSEAAMHGPSPGDNRWSPKANSRQTMDSVFCFRSWKTDGSDLFCAQYVFMRHLPSSSSPRFKSGLGVFFRSLEGLQAFKPFQAHKSPYQCLCKSETRT